jgi:hypothetical protein
MSPKSLLVSTIYKTRVATSNLARSARECFDYWTVRQAKDSRLMSVAGCIFALGFALITLGAFSYHSLGGHYRARFPTRTLAKTR